MGAGGGPTAPPPALVSWEINPSDDADYSFPSIGALWQVDDTLYFSADDGTHGWELWRSDGTAAGTTLVNDLNPRGDGANPFNERAVVGQTLYFVARRTDGRPGLWTVVRKPSRPACRGVLSTIRGSGRIIGTAGLDVIVGGRGKDTIDGRGGDDIICAGAGDDFVVGREGHDGLCGQAGNDRLVGGRGRTTSAAIAAPTASAFATRSDATTVATAGPAPTPRPATAVDSSTRVP